MSKHISSGAIVYRYANNMLKILVMYRKKTDTWHLPKGTCHEAEHLEDTAFREVKEETGLQIKL